MSNYPYFATNLLNGPNGIRRILSQQSEIKGLEAMPDLKNLRLTRLSVDEGLNCTSANYEAESAALVPGLKNAIESIGVKREKISAHTSGTKDNQSYEALQIAAHDGVILVNLIVYKIADVK